MSLKIHYLQIAFDYYISAGEKCLNSKIPSASQINFVVNIGTLGRQSRPTQSFIHAGPDHASVGAVRPQFRIVPGRVPVI